MSDSTEASRVHDAVSLAAALRRTAVELLDGREVRSDRLALLLQYAASALVRQEKQARVAPPPAGAQRLEKVKERYSRAYERWGPEEDERLRELHGEGCSVKELSEILERQPSAIRSRLVRLSLERPV